MKSRFIFTSLLLIFYVSLSFTPSSADPKKETNTITRELKESKSELVKCRKSVPEIRYPKPIEMPKGISKRLPGIVIFETNCGSISIETLAKQAPLTITVVSRLVRSGFYDKTMCHRITNNDYFFLQCGDPTGTGFGVPDFEYKAENLPASKDFIYSKGTVAMTNSSFRRNGSQFMIFYDDSRLPTGYTVWGRVISGIEIVRYIAEAGTRDGSDDGIPMRPISIERAIIGN